MRSPPGWRSPSWTCARAVASCSPGRTRTPRATRPSRVGPSARSTRRACSSSTRTSGDGTLLSFTAEAQLPEEYELEVLAGWHIHLDHLEHVLDGGRIDWASWSRDHMPEFERIRAAYEASGATAA